MSRIKNIFLTLEEKKETEVKYIGQKVSDWEKHILTAYINFLLEKLDISFPKLTVRSLAKQKGNVIGYVADIEKVRKNKIKINAVFGSIIYSVRHITHELYHVKQILKNELDYDEDGIRWNNKKHISIEDYRKLKSISDFDNLPWEKEAYDNQDKFYDAFVKSDVFFELSKIRLDGFFPDTLNKVVKSSYKGSKKVKDLVL